MQGGWTGTGSNNIDGDPLFINAIANNLRLQACSPCIDTGNNSDIPGGVTTDLDGNPRIAGATVDMGAYETQVFADSDGDGVDDACDICPGFDDNGPDTDGDGIPDDCDIRLVHNITQGTEHFTLQTAIDAAVDDDIIEADPGVYTEAIDFNSRTITLRSASGDPTDTIIDGTGNFHVVLCVSSGSPTFQGFTITGGDASTPPSPNVFGGGMYNDGTSPMVIDCIFTGNSAAVDGGGMYNTFANPTVINCLFDQNMAHTSGGAMFNDNSTLTIINSIFTGNTAVFGGAINNDGSSPNITNCAFSSNSADSGGAIFNVLSGSPQITNSTFSANTATGNGGGVYNIDMNPVFNNCIFWNNSDSSGMGQTAQINIATGSPTVNFSALKGGWTGNGSNNIDAATHSLSTPMDLTTPSERQMMICTCKPVRPASIPETH